MNTEDFLSARLVGDTDFDFTIKAVKDISGSIMVEVEAVGDADDALGTRNAFGGDRLRTYHANGYVAVAVGGGDDRHSAWFERADAVDFGDPGPNGEYELHDNLTARVVESGLTVFHHDEDIAYIDRDGWTLDVGQLTVLSKRIRDALYDTGFTIERTI